MGSFYCDETFRVTTVAEFEKVYREYLDRKQSEYGHRSYNGTLTTCGWPEITKLRFNSLDEAEEYISKHTDKRDALAVQVADVSPYDELPAAVKAREKMQQLYEEAAGLIRQAVREFRDSGKKSRKCSFCGVTSEARVIRSHWCPACQNEHFLFSAVLRNKHATVTKRLTAARTAYDTAKRDYYAKKAALKGTKTIWYVGGWVAE